MRLKGKDDVSPQPFRETRRLQDITERTRTWPNHEFLLSVALHLVAHSHSKNFGPLLPCSCGDSHPEHVLSGA